VTRFRRFRQQPSGNTGLELQVSVSGFLMKSRSRLEILKESRSRRLRSRLPEVACRGGGANVAPAPIIQGRGASKEWNYKNL